MLVHAMVGGVGLKAVEYAHVLAAGVIGNAGQPVKHAQASLAGVALRCSSRDDAAFAYSAVRLVCGHRLHAVLNLRDSVGVAVEVGDVAMMELASSV